MKADKCVSMSVVLWEEPDTNGNKTVLVSINNQHGTWWTGNQEEFAQLFLGCREALSPVARDRFPQLLQDLYTLAKRGRLTTKRPAQSEQHGRSLSTLWKILEA